LIPEAVDNTKKPTIETHDQDELRERILSKVCSNEPEVINLILACISRLSASYSEPNFSSAKVEPEGGGCGFAGGTVLAGRHHLRSQFHHGHRLRMP